MVKKRIPYPPKETDPDNLAYYTQINEEIGKESGLEWSVINKEGSNLTDIETRNHNDLQDVLEADDTDGNDQKNKHVSNADMKAARDHREATNAHGANGDILGKDDHATTAEYGVVKQSETEADATTTVAGTAGVTYTASEQGMINALKADTEALRDKINDLIGKLQTAGLME